MNEFLQLPAGIRNTLAVLSGTTVVGALSFFDKRLALIVGIGLVILLITVAAFFLIRNALRKRRANSMASAMNAHSSSAPSGVSDAAGRAELDRLRQKFQEGLAKFGNVENTYKFPWYVVVGEPGSGKTEAIRRCNVGFPPGMQDELQGTGGTINMNWWFTNQAVFLDTAGKMMFKDVKPGETSEWKEFLQLLSKNRPNCPINGLLLTIPADALIKDNDGKLHEKASRIAQQFEVIQRALDIRFPVFVIITKCDLLSGFREFFDDFADVNSVNQMLGWSNPEDRDVAFAPERVTDHLQTVVERIKKRRLSILRDPIPRDGDRRADEVDALYALPQSFQLIAPRLRQYLEKIFVAGPWSPKPLFLRGIYFTSSMREGSALDQELAQALGITTDKLPEGKVWEKERAYFLRDIFTEKVFREKGLVTRATNTKKMLRTRSLVLWGTASALSLLFVGFTLYAYRQFSDSIKQHSDMWATAKVPEDWKRHGNWKPIVSPGNPADTVVKFRGIEPPLRVGSKEIPLLKYLSELKDVAQQPIETGWVFRPMVKLADIDDKRLEAQRIVFEASSIYPLVEAARNRMLNEPLDKAADVTEEPSVRFDREAKALLALIRIEADKTDSGKLGKVADLPDTVFYPLLQYASTRLSPASTEDWNQFRTVFDHTYTKNPSGKWVPARLPIGDASLASNKPIEAGFKRLDELAKETLEKQRLVAADVAKLRDDLRTFRKIEEDMNSIAKGLDSAEEKETKIKDQLVKLTSVKAAIDKHLEGNVLDRSAPSLSGAYKSLVTDSQVQSGARFKQFSEAVKPFLTRERERLYADIDKRITDGQAALEKSLKETFSEDEQKEFEGLDVYLYDYQDGGASSRVYAGRFSTYKKADEIASASDATENLVGSGWKSLADMKSKIKDFRGVLAARQSDLSPAAAKVKLPDVIEPCNRLLDGGESRRVKLLASAYLKQTEASVEDGLFFPFVLGAAKAGPGWTQQKAKDLISAWERDFATETYATTVPDTVKTRLSGLKEALERMKRGPEDAARIDAENKQKKAEFDEDMKSLSYSVSVGQSNDWHKANGKEIFNIPPKDSVYIGSFSHGGSVSIELTVNDGAKRPVSFQLNADNVGSGARFGVSYHVERKGTLPKKPIYKQFGPPDFNAPSKPDILSKLRGN